MKNSPSPEKVFSRSGNGSGTIRVKDPSEAYSEKRYSAVHSKTGRPVFDPVFRRECTSMSEASQARAGVFLISHQGKEAVDMLRQVIELDPDFAEAHELLAASYWSAGGGTIDNTEAFTLMGEAAAKALAINPDLPFAQALYDISPGANPSYPNEIEAFERGLACTTGQFGTTATTNLLPVIRRLST